MPGYLSPEIICSSKLTVFLELRSRKTVRFSEQTMSKDKYPSIFSPQMEAIVFIILQIFFATRAVLKIGKYSRLFTWPVFRPIAREWRDLMDYSRFLGCSLAGKRPWERGCKFTSTPTRHQPYAIDNPMQSKTQIPHGTVKEHSRLFSA